VMQVWRVLLRHSAQLHEPSPHVAVDATYYERSPASKHYCERTNSVLPERGGTGRSDRWGNITFCMITWCISMPTDQEPTMRTNYTTTATRTADFERIHDRTVADSAMVSGRGL